MESWKRFPYSGLLGIHRWAMESRHKGTVKRLFVWPSCWANSQRNSHVQLLPVIWDAMTLHSKHLNTLDKRDESVPEISWNVDGRWYRYSLLCGISDYRFMICPNEDDLYQNFAEMTRLLKISFQNHHHRFQASSSKLKILECRENWNLQRVTIIYVRHGHFSDIISK